MPSGIIQNRVTDGLIVRGILRDGLIPVVPDIVNTVAPVISGVTYTGQTLSTTNGTYNVTPDSFTYQWYSGGSPIAGATSQTYDVTSDEEGTSIYCEVTAIKAGFDDAVTDSNALHHFVALDASPRRLYDASDTSTIISSANLASTWQDKGLDNDNATQTTGSAQPITGTRTVGGLNALDFDSAAKWMTMDNRNFNPDTPFAIFAVGKQDTDDSKGAILGMVGKGNKILVDFNDDLFVRITNGGADDTTPWTPSNNPFQVGIERDSDNHVHANINGSAQTTLVTDNGLSKWSYIGRIDAGPPTQCFDGLLCEIIMIAGPVSTAIRQKIEGYLAWKWGLLAYLALSHPYKSTPPTP